MTGPTKMVQKMAKVVGATSIKGISIVDCTKVFMSFTLRGVSADILRKF